VMPVVRLNESPVMTNARAPELKVIVAKLVLVANVLVSVKLPWVFVLPKVRLDPVTGVLDQLVEVFQFVFVAPDQVEVAAGDELKQTVTAPNAAARVLISRPRDRR